MKARTQRSYVSYFNHVADDVQPVLRHGRQGPRERLPGHSKLPCDAVFLQRQPHRHVGCCLQHKPEQVAADALLCRAELQVLHQLYLAAELRCLAGKNRQAERMIGYNGLAESFRLDEDEVGFLLDAPPRQIGLPIQHRRWKQQIDRPHDLDQGLIGPADADQLHTACHQELREGGDFGLLEQPAPRRHPMQDGLFGQPVERGRGYQTEPRGLAQRRAGRRRRDGRCGSRCRLTSDKIRVPVSFHQAWPFCRALSESVASTVKAATGIPVFKWDVSNTEACAAGVARVTANIGPVEVLVNNAGIARDTFLHKMTVEQWYEVINTNLNSAFNMCRPVIEGMRERNFGRIIAISSVNGQNGQMGQSNYAAAKAGEIGFTKALALENAAKGITVNVVCPGYTATDMVTAVAPEVIAKRILPQIPVGRLGEPEEVARYVVFLAADEAGFITGSTLTVNGGQYTPFTSQSEKLVG